MPRKPATGHAPANANADADQVLKLATASIRTIKPASDPFGGFGYGWPRRAARLRACRSVSERPVTADARIICRVAAPRQATPKPPRPQLKAPAEEVERFFAALAAANPSPHTELVYRNPFTLLVAVVLSAQATDQSASTRLPGPLFAAAPTPGRHGRPGRGRIRDHIQTIGLFRTKARNVLALSRAARAPRRQVPRERAALEALPGVGRKTANVVLNEAFGEFRPSRSIPMCSGWPIAPASRPGRRPRWSRPASSG